MCTNMGVPLIIERQHLSGVSPQILNVTLTEANTEYFFEIPDGTRQYTFKTRDPNHPLKFSFEENMTNTIYMSLNTLSYSEDTVLMVGVKVYCQSPVAGCVVEVLILR